MTANPVRSIAFYLPQYHPIPENDAWWGKGFTEWTNVAKAKPLFPGHTQPQLPADLGFYDLRVPETRIAQAEMARDFGIEGFCYWHYWFAGRRLLQRPFNEVLRSGEPDFPFCLAWANQSWTGVWHGEADRILVEQTYPGTDDYAAHFRALIDAFVDQRYVTVQGKPLFIVYDTYGMPEPLRFTDCWRELAIKTGFKGLYLAAIAAPSWNPAEHGFDAAIIENPGSAFAGLGVSFAHRAPRSRPIPEQVIRKIRDKMPPPLRQDSGPRVYLYEDAVKYALPPLSAQYEQFPCVIPNWDNTPRSGVRGIVLQNSTPDLFREHLRQAVGQVSGREREKRLVFVKSWNEWAEGNYLEPDQQFGSAYLEVVRSELRGRG